MRRLDRSCKHSYYRVHVYLERHFSYNATFKVSKSRNEAEQRSRRYEATQDLCSPVIDPGELYHL
jgi:hypothetical protein